MEMMHVIANCRMKKGISQKKLGTAVGVSSSTVALWETGKRNPTVNTLIRIADYFNVSMDILFSLDRKNNSYIREDNGSLPEDGKRLISYFDTLDEEGKAILMGEAIKLARQQRLEKEITSYSNNKSK